MTDPMEPGSQPGRGDGATDGEQPRLVLDGLLEGCQVIGPDFRYRYANAAVARQASTTVDRLLGRTMMEVFPGIEATEMFTVLRRCLDDGVPRQMENEFTFADGSRRWFELRFQPAHDGVTILSLDITERKRAEAQGAHLNAVLRGIRAVNQLITQETDRSRLLRRACGLLTETRSYRSAWIGLLDEAGRLHVAGESGLDAGSAALAAQLERGEPPACCRLALAERDVVVTHVPTPDCTQCALAPAGRDAAALATALRHAGHDYGVLVVALPAAVADDAEERSLLHEVAGDLGFALHAMATEQARSRAAESLRESEALYRTLFDHMLNGFAYCRMLFDGDRPQDFVYLAVNHAFEVQTGLKDVVGKRVTEVIPGIREKDPLLFEIYGRVARTGVPERFETYVDALRMWFEIAVYSPARDHFVAVFDVITERKQAEAALLASEERFRTLVDGAPDGVFVQSEGLILYVNPALVKLLGAARAEDVLGTDCMARIAPEYLEAVRSRIRAQLQTGEPAPPMEQEYLRLDGSRVPVETTAVALRYQGRPAHLIYVRDCAARRKAEAERESLQAQLRQAQKIESVGRLAGGVAHDFNNMLSVIISNADFAADGLAESDPRRADIDEIQKAGLRAAALTRQLLAFSRKQVLVPEVLDLNRVVRDIESMLGRLLGEDIDLEAHLAENLGRTLADPGQLEQVIMNLAINARDAMPQGGKLTIESANAELDEDYAALHVDVKPGRYVQLSVTDTGLGIDAATKEHLFEPFFTTKAKGKGTGLGLSTVYGIVRQSGGYIWVYSEPGRGTTFKVYLPRVDAPATEPRHEPAPTMVGGHETVLLVEDEPAVRKLAERILQSAGYTVLSAAGGGDALLQSEKHAGPIALLLTDVVMPQMSGRELADRLLLSRPTLKVLYMSGYTDNAIVHHGVLDPGTRFVGKPFSAATLTRKVREALDGA